MLAQNFLHVNSLWKECLAASDRSQTLDAKTISNILNKYLVTEMVVKRHEPVYLSQYRQRRTADKPNISHATWQELGESQCSVSHTGLTRNAGAKITQRTWRTCDSSGIGLEPCMGSKSPT